MYTLIAQVYVHLLAPLVYRAKKLFLVGQSSEYFTLLPAAVFCVPDDPKWI